MIAYDKIPKFIGKALVADLASVDICCNSQFGLIAPSKIKTCTGCLLILLNKITRYPLSGLKVNINSLEMEEVKVLEDELMKD